ncbi:MAG: preprotein translocase subunit SecA [Actinomycetota bacterium]|nr:preprotein translocase subunit SecA [Actinomycetota bacterium]
MKLLDKILKAGDGKRLKTIESVVAPVNNLEPEFDALTDDALRAKTAAFKERLEHGEDLDDLLPEAFATVREAARRVIGQRHYDVQLMGGAALHWGWVAEMKTGEGKTLVSTLPVYLNGLGGKGVHVVTVNDYLASRDAEWMGRVHKWLGLSVGLIVPGRQDSGYKRTQYASDITYSTNNELGFDYLRDNMARARTDMVQRGHSFAIVDEIDSILIDEARTPLIISGKVRGAADLYYRFADIVKQLVRDEHYDVDEEKRQVAITEEGITRVEEILEIDNLYDGVQQDLVHQLGVALRAKELFRRDKDYLVADGEVKIVDEFTGRVLDGRRWSDGLHQAVEAKEGVRIKEEQQTLATVTLQNYFRMYDKLGGMTGTAQSDAAELETTYGLAVVQVPTNRPLVRLDQPDLIFKSELSKFAAVIDDIQERVEKGQPVLVGTASVEKSELLSKLLNERKLPHEVLNAKQHFREAEIVAQAGKAGAVTVATNMAGRGVDIILGGNAEKLAERDTIASGHELGIEEGDAYLATRLEYWESLCSAEGDKVREAGGLYVLGTERHESRRIDNQLRGRSGRQGDQGESRFYLSLEDDLMRIFATGAMNWVMDKAMPDDVPIESKAVTKSVERAQTSVEQRNAEIRKNVLKYDEVFNEQRKVIYARRMQVLEEQNLRDESLDAIAGVGRILVDTYCADDLDDTWDVEGLHADLATFWATKLTVDDLAGAKRLDDLAEMISEEGRELYLSREEELTPVVMRQIERQVMLQLADQRWREHLNEMDHLREGINLRAMGQRDPLIEWQREGFNLFSDMMTGLSTDFVKYVMHVQVVQQPVPATQPPVDTDDDEIVDAEMVDAETVEAQPQPERRPAARKPARSAPVQTTNVTSAKAEARSLLRDEPTPTRVAAPQTVVKDEWDKTPRNAACPCGSGKKFKQCHGR